MQDISKTYNPKREKKRVLLYGKTDVYLGYQIWRHRYPEDDSDFFCYAISGDHYMKNIVSNVQKKLTDQGRELNTKQQPQLLNGYEPELDKLNGIGH